MSSVGTIDTTLKANTKKYDSRINKSRTYTQAFASSLKNVSIGAAAFGVSVAATYKTIESFVTSAARIGDEIGKGAGRIGISTLEFQSLNFAMEQSGGDSKKLETAFRGMNMAIRRLQDGTPTTIKTFKELGISIADIEGLNSADQFRLIAKSLQNIEDPARRAAIAQELFSRAGADVQLLAQGLSAYEKEFNDLNLEIDSETVSRLEQINDLVNVQSKAWDKLIAEIGVELLPAFKGATDLLISALEKALEIHESIKSSVNEMRGLPDHVKAINGASDAELQRFLDKQAKEEERKKQAPIEAERQGKISEVDKQIEAQKELIQAIKDQGTKLAPLPQALQKGTQAQIGFMAQLDRQNQQAKIDAREQKKISLAEKHLKELEDIRKGLTEQNNEIEVAIL